MLLQQNTRLIEIARAEGSHYLAFMSSIYRKIRTAKMGFDILQDFFFFSLNQTEISKSFQCP